MARQRKAALHDWTTRVVAAAAAIEAVCPPIREHTKSAKGDFRAHGAAVETVAELNRSTLAQAPALSLAMLEYKAAEAGIAFARVEPDATKLSVGSKLPTSIKAVRKVRRKLKEVA
ncbi:MAG: hypothetical protein K2Q06_07655 [Parvularculaceae bacterium]|nr:hypothetical protein [Parvularculaceae bacterium]